MAAVLSTTLGSLPSASQQRVDPVEFQMKNVNTRFAQDIVLEVDHLRGRLRRTRTAVPVTLDDVASFTVEVDFAQVAVSAESLMALMNSWVLAGNKGSLKGVSISLPGDKLIVKGTIHKGVALPFEVEGSVSASRDGRVRVHAQRIKAGPVPVKGLLHFFGEDLSTFVKQNAGRGMALEGDDIMLTPSALTPPPHLEGRVTRAWVKNGKILEIFDSGRHTAALPLPLESPAYIYHRGGVLRFGKLTMNDADLEIVGDKPGRFNFFPKEYQKQLIAGYSKNTPVNGLVAHMADYSHFVAHPPAQANPGSNSRSQP